MVTACEIIFFSRFNMLKQSFGVFKAIALFYYESPRFCKHSDSTIVSK